jgi:hypothetical protein
MKQLRQIFLKITAFAGMVLLKIRIVTFASFLVCEQLMLYFYGSRRFLNANTALKWFKAIGINENATLKF